MMSQIFIIFKPSLSKIVVALLATTTQRYLYVNQFLPRIYKNICWNHRLLTIANLTEAIINKMRS